MCIYGPPRALFVPPQVRALCIVPSLQTSERVFTGETFTASRPEVNSFATGCVLVLIFAPAAPLDLQSLVYILYCVLSLSTPSGRCQTNIISILFVLMRPFNPGRIYTGGNKSEVKNFTQLAKWAVGPRHPPGGKVD